MYLTFKPKTCIEITLLLIVMLDYVGWMRTNEVELVAC